MDRIHGETTGFIGGLGEEGFVHGQRAEGRGRMAVSVKMGKAPEAAKRGRAFFTGPKGTVQGRKVERFGHAAAGAVPGLLQPVTQVMHKPGMVVVMGCDVLSGDV